MIQNMIFVTEEEANRYYVAPGHQVMLMNRDKPIFYVKSSDTFGMATMEQYSFTKIPNPQQQSPTSTVTREDFDAFKQEILSLLSSKSQPKEDAQHNESAKQEW